MVKREIRIKQQKRTAYLQPILFPSVQWVLKDWGAWTRHLPALSDFENPLDQSYCPEEWYISDDHAFLLERELKQLERYDAFICGCLTRYYLVRNMTLRDLSRQKNINKNRLSAILRMGESWLHRGAHTWVDPLYAEYLRWQKEKARRETRVKNIVDSLSRQEV